MRFECQNCRTAYVISDCRVRGKVLKIRCRNCGQMVEVRDRPPSGVGEKSLPPAAGPEKAKSAGKKTAREEDATLFDPVAASPRLAAAKKPVGQPAAPPAEEDEGSRLDLLERVHRKRQQVRADRQADRIAEYFFQSTHLMGETPGLPPPPVAGAEPPAGGREDEVKAAESAVGADPLEELVRRPELPDEISKVTRVLAEQARLGAKDTGRRLGITLAIIFGLVGMLSGLVALGVSQGWFSIIGLGKPGGETTTGSANIAFEQRQLSTEESRRLREQLWEQKRRAAGGSVLAEVERPKESTPAAPPPTEEEKKLLAFYQQEAERKREVAPRTPKELLHLPALAELSLPDAATVPGSTTPEVKREIVPQAPGQLTVGGELSEFQIKLVIDSHYPQLKSCLEHQLKRDARVSGKLLVTAKVNAKGKVVKAWIPTEKFRGTFVEECLTKEVSRWEFPPFSGDDREISFPLLLSAQAGG